LSATDIRFSEGDSGTSAASRAPRIPPEDGPERAGAVLAIYQARTPRSRELHERARSALPGGDTRTGTFFAPHPVFIARGEGCVVHDVDGNSYVDFLNNFTSLVHGHAHPEVMAAVRRQLDMGSAHAAPIEPQLELAERLQKRVPSLERVRFTNSGTEAVMQAIRAARAFTGRTLLGKMRGGYHGSYDATEVGVDPGGMTPGVPPRIADETLVADFNDLASVERLVETHARELAAVIVEPMLHSGGIIPADRDFLTGVREITRKHGVLLILDEIVTLRLSVGGAQRLYGIAPDLTTMGKTIGGGFPVGALGGRADVMDRFDPRRADRISHSGTFNGNPITMVAGNVAVGLMTAEELARIDALAERLARGFQRVFDEAGVAAQVTRAGSLAQIHLVDGPVRDYDSAARTDRTRRSLLHIALMNRGVFCGSRLNFNASTAMDEGVVDAAVAALSGAVMELEL
jgi:glutamate-1-semialdehyde 2,1-aminomutase